VTASSTSFAESRGLWHGHGVSYCEECWTEFVDTVPRCSDCGGPLQAGELPAARPLVEEAPDVAVAGAVDLSAIDSLIVELPGEDAEHYAEALRMEGVHSRLECGEFVRFRGPGQKPTGPISLRAPVRVFVATDDKEQARDILESVGQEDLVGDAWLEGVEAEEIDDGDAEPPPAAESAHDTPPEARAEGVSSGAVVVLLLAVALGLIFLFAR